MEKILNLTLTNKVDCKISSPLGQSVERPKPPGSRDSGPVWFPRLAKVMFLSVAWQHLHIFPLTAPVTRCPALGSELCVFLCLFKLILLEPLTNLVGSVRRKRTCIVFFERAVE